MILKPPVMEMLALLLPAFVGQDDFLTAGVAGSPSTMPVQAIMVDCSLIMQTGIDGI